MRRAPRWFCAVDGCGQVLKLRTSGSGKQPTICDDCKRERLAARYEARQARGRAPVVDRSKPQRCACGALYTLASTGAVPESCPDCATNPHQRWRRAS